MLNIVLDILHKSTYLIFTKGSKVKIIFNFLVEKLILKEVKWLSPKVSKYQWQNRFKLWLADFKPQLFPQYLLKAYYIKYVFVIMIME